MFGKIRIVFASRAAELARRAQAALSVAPPIPLRRLWWAAVVLLGISASAVMWTIYQLRVDAITAAISESGSIATVLAGQLSRSLRSIDDVLLDVKKQIEQENIATASGFPAGFDGNELLQTLSRDLASMRQVFSIAVADRNGQLVVSTLSGVWSRYNIGDRDYFQDARDRHDGQLSISIPAANRVNGERTIVFARRLEDSKGNFVGVVFASVNTRYFEDIYGAIQSVHSLLFTLLNPDGIILFRHPDDRNSAGQMLSNKVQWQEALERSDAVLRLRGKADDNVRYVSIRRVPDYPLVVDISLTESTVLDTWARRAATIIVGSSIFLIFSFYLLGAITRQVRSLSDSKASLAQKSQQLDAAVSNMSQGLTMFDGHQRLLVFNEQFMHVYGLASEQIRLGMTFRDILEARAAIGAVPLDIDNFVKRSLEQVAKPEPSDAVYTFRDGRSVSISLQRMPDGGWVSIHQDITEQKRIEAELEHQARYDALTGLANRLMLTEKVGEALARLRRHGEQFSILMLDLDRFKAVNDSLGHPAGDALLKEVGRRLQKTVREVDCVARLGGDEFAVLQAPEKNQVDAAGALSGRILKAFTEPFNLDGRKLVIETSIGISIAPQDGDDADILIKNADLALYKAKAEGRNRYSFFELALETKARESRELEDSLRQAILLQEFELHYQTIFDIENNRCGAAEALVRWRHPERGIVGPDRFIPFAEESGLIVPLGRWILRQACTDAVKWPPSLRVGVNLSPVQFRQGDLLDVVKSALKDTGLPAERLIIEITETVLLENNAENLRLLHEFKKLGISIVLDDFGIGYSSMTYLQTFPFDGLKIDQSFIRTMSDHAGAAIVCAIAGLGRSLNIATTAEGVETIEQLTFLRAAGCQFAQGYLLGRPVPVRELVLDLPDSLRSKLRAA
jgi:diguanylate cyclase (GGDEF)-like protein